ncbi:unnamed protein product [Mytilus coruscus]|nr:unnamed protein product [Mytilus coruscus]
MSLVNINTCSFHELLQLPGIGIKTGEQIMDIRDGKGFVTEADLATLSHLSVTMALIARLDFSTNGGGRNIGPPPEARGKHQSMINTIIDMGMVASPGMPCQTHGQSVFKQEGWHQGQSPGAWEGSASWTLPSLSIVHIMRRPDLGLRPQLIGAGSTGNSCRKKSGATTTLVTQTRVKTLTPGVVVVLGTSRIGQAKTVLGKRVPNLKGEHLLIPGVTPWFMQAIIQDRGHHLAPNQRTPVRGSMRHPIVGMVSGKIIGARTQGRPPARTYGDRQDNRDEDTRQTPARTYGDRQDNRGEDTRQTPARTYGDRQPEGRPRENTRGPDSRGGSRVSSSASKVSNAPKNIKYEGKGNWQAFFTKFARYPEVCEWGPQECIDQLCWCLEGKASDYNALITERDRETARVQFNNARQAPEESLEDWADRVLSLATRAFRNLPDEYMYEQAVTRLCQGIENKELGVQVCNLQPQSIEEAVDKIRLFQHNTQAMHVYGKPIRREVRQVMSGRYEDHPEAYHEYQVPHERATMVPERAPASAWKAELEKTDRKFNLVHEKLDDIMGQFKKLLPCPVAGSP